MCTSDFLTTGCLAVLLIAGAATTGCDRDEGWAIGGEGDGATGRIRVLLTDAPLDDPAVADVYLTFTGIRIGDDALPNLTERQSVDISNYTSGRTIQYGTDQSVPAGLHEGITVTFDLGRDATGAAPGAYVTDAAGAKSSLDYGPRTIELRVADRFEVPEGALTELVLDVDLRRALQRRANGGYTFGGDAALGSSLRLIQKASSGTVEGQVLNHEAASGTTRIVYALPEGRFSAAAAREDDFAAAVTSASVNPAGRFRLSYLPAGQYDLIVVDYADEDGDGRIDLLGARVSDAVIEEAARAVTVSASAQTNIEIVLGEML